MWTLLAACFLTSRSSANICFIGISETQRCLDQRLLLTTNLPSALSSAPAAKTALEGPLFLDE